MYEALGIQPHQVIQPHCRMLVEADELLRAVAADAGLPARISQHALGGAGHSRASRLAASIIHQPPQDGHAHVGQTGPTRGAFAIAWLRDARHGGLFAGRAGSLVYESEMIVATHGAGLANLLFARPNTQVIEIVPQGRFNATCYPKKSRILGLQQVRAFYFAPTRPAQADSDGFARQCERPCLGLKNRRIIAPRHQIEAVLKSPGTVPALPTAAERDTAGRAAASPWSGAVS